MEKDSIEVLADATAIMCATVIQSTIPVVRGYIAYRKVTRKLIAAYLKAFKRSCQEAGVTRFFSDVPSLKDQLIEALQDLNEQNNKPVKKTKGHAKTTN